MSHRTHNYTRQQPGANYVLESIAYDRFSMTGYGGGVKPGDFIVVRENAQTVRYQVEQIDYYADPPDLWLAVLRGRMLSSSTLQWQKWIILLTHRIQGWRFPSLRNR